KHPALTTRMSSLFELTVEPIASAQPKATLVPMPATDGTSFTPDDPSAMLSPRAGGAPLSASFAERKRPSAAIHATTTPFPSPSGTSEAERPSAIVHTGELGQPALSSARV